MMTPYRGRGRGNTPSYGRGRGRNPPPDLQTGNVPLIGDWTIFRSNRSYQRSATRDNVARGGNTPRDNTARGGNTPPNIPSSSNTAYRDSVTETAPELEYLENPFTEQIMFVENEDLKLSNNDGWSIKTRYLEHRGYPGFFNHSRMYLEVLLKITESVTITHNHNNGNPEDFISFSKCHINKILTPREWGLNPNAEKAIKISDSKYIYFNYWDYVEAFTKVFYYQNPKNKHSWFFTINPGILVNPLPNWVYNWWTKIGPSLEILPKSIMDLYTPWSDSSPLISSRATLGFGQCPLFFFAQFQLPWIWRWTVSIETDMKLNIPFLRRNFFYKWWNRMNDDDIEKIIANIQNTISENILLGNKKPVIQHGSISQVKEHLKRKYPLETDDQIMIRILDHMKGQFFSTFPQQTHRDDVSMKSQASQGSSDLEEDARFNYLAGESQDTLVISPNDPTPEDLWNSMTIMMAEQYGKGKSPAP